MWKKILTVIAVITLMLCVAIVGSTKGAESDMFIEVYDKDGIQIANINIEKWSITQRVFEFDTSIFEGTCEEDITEGLIFVFKDETGKQRYSGFMKNITQDGKYVKFKGDDLRRMFDTDILLDYTAVKSYTVAEDFINVYNIFWGVLDEVVAQLPATGPGIQAQISADFRSTAFISNPTGNYFVVNAWKYLKPYMAYYGYYLKVTYNNTGATAKYVIEFVSASSGESIKLDDFAFDKTTSEAKINHVVAILKEDLQKEDHQFTYSSEELYNATPVSLQNNKDLTYQTYFEDKNPSNFDDESEDHNYDDIFRVQLWEFDQVGDPDRTFYMQIVTNSDQRVEPVRIEYWLGKDNEIYYNSIPSEQEITPAITKIFEAEYLGAAQFEGIFMLVNSRYVEYIVLTESTNIPIDIRTLSLYETITVYDSNGSSKDVPVSEIKWTQDGYEVKLGFKKTLFTQIIKGD